MNLIKSLTDSAEHVWYAMHHFHNHIRIHIHVLFVIFDHDKFVCLKIDTIHNYCYSLDSSSNKRTKREKNVQTNRYNGRDINRGKFSAA